MEEENKNMEQPVDEVTQVKATNAEGNKEVNTSEHGSINPKFKDAKALSDAYDKLQAEFTKKCQKLSELEKKLSDNASAPPAENGLSLKDKMTKFLDENEDAKPYAKEMVNYLFENEKVRGCANAIELAYINALKAKTNELEHIDVANEALNNSDIRKKVIELYLGELKKQKTPPVVSGEMGGGIGFKKIATPLSIKEAGEIAKKFFE